MSSLVDVAVDGEGTSTVEKAAPEPVEKTAPEPVEEAVSEPVEKAVPEPVEKAAPAPAADAGAEPAASPPADVAALADQAGEATGQGQSGGMTAARELTPDPGAVAGGVGDAVEGAADTAANAAGDAAESAAGAADPVSNTAGEATATSGEASEAAGNAVTNAGQTVSETANTAGGQIKTDSGSSSSGGHTDSATVETAQNQLDSASAQLQGLQSTVSNAIDGAASATGRGGTRIDRAGDAGNGPHADGSFSATTSEPTSALGVLHSEEPAAWIAPGASGPMSAESLGGDPSPNPGAVETDLSAAASSGDSAWAFGPHSFEASDVVGVLASSPVVHAGSAAAAATLAGLAAWRYGPLVSTYAGCVVVPGVQGAAGQVAGAAATRLTAASQQLAATGREAFVLGERIRGSGPLGGLRSVVSEAPRLRLPGITGMIDAPTRVVPLTAIRAALAGLALLLIGLGTLPGRAMRAVRVGPVPAQLRQPAVVAGLAMLAGVAVLGALL